MHRLQYFKEELIKLKSRLEKQMDVLSKQDSEPLKESTGELSSYDNHSADLGAETFEREKDLGLKGNVKDLLKKVDYALDKINDGTYGKCDKCGKKIEEERLKALPYATLCASCKLSEEKKTPSKRRPIEEEVLRPFAKGMDDTDKAAYDGEDTWQDVARYGTANGPQDVGGAENYQDCFIDSAENRGSVEKIDEIAHKRESR